MSHATAPLEDIPDLYGWVAWQVKRFLSSGRLVSTDEREELRNQGVLILFELHADWDRGKCRKFSAYAISLFQKRLIDWYRKELTSSCRGHIPQAKGGKRGPIQYHSLVSLNAPAGAEGRETVETFHAEPALTHWDAVE